MTEPDLTAYTRFRNLFMIRVFSAARRDLFRDSHKRNLRLSQGTIATSNHILNLLPFQPSGNWAEFGPVKEFTQAELMHLRAARGWLELGAPP